MKLAPFLEGLFQHGSVQVEGQIISFEETDLERSLELLKQNYDLQIIEMPLQAPSFDPIASTWAANYLYKAIQLVMLRGLDEEAILVNLKGYEGIHSGEAVYSVDLVFKYLPDVFKLAKGFAPDDPLIKQLKTEIEKWPFSSVGIDISSEIDESVILGHPSLRYTYIDRIIRAQDQKRLNKPELIELAKEVLGDYTSELWPDMELKFQNDKV